MYKILLITILLLTSGCAKISPFSPNNKQKINNNGQIEDIKNNQNGIMADILKLKNKLDIMARDIENLQQGIVNNNNRNYGVQILQGDGSLIFIFALAICGFVIFNYRSKSIRYKKAAEIMGKQIKGLKNLEIENEVFALAIYEKVEKDVYEFMKNQQS